MISWNLNFLKSKWAWITIGLVGLGIIAFIWYTEANATSQTDKAAAAVENGGVGAGIGANIHAFFTNLFGSSSPQTDGTTSTGS